MYRIVFTHRMRKDARQMEKRGKDLSKLTGVLSCLSSGEPLPVRCKDHPLIGTLRGFRECHIEPDWLLLYQICEDTLILTATATGSHSDLFHS